LKNSLFVPNRQNCGEWKNIPTTTRIAYGASWRDFIFAVFAAGRFFDSQPRLISSIIALFAETS
jgi:hypothetical protein